MHRVTVTVGAGPNPYSCPECQESVPGYDRKRRRWRQLNIVSSRRGSSRPGNQLTAWFERLALDLLLECSVTGALGLLRLIWDEA